MIAFVEAAIVAAGLGSVLAARRAGVLAADGATLTALQSADLLALGALADEARILDVGDTVLLHDRSRAGDGVRWIDRSSEIDALRELAIARVVFGGRVGIDWSGHGIEIAQV